MRSGLFAILFIVATTAACKKEAPPEDEAPAGTTTAAPVATGPSPKAKAKEIFATRCVPCHGSIGAGDGVASAGLTPKPRAFSDAAWQASVDDAYLEKIIKFGGAAVGKSPAMPGNPDLNDPAVVAELRSVVRSFKR